MAKGKLDMAAFNKSMNSLDKAFVERLDKIEKAFVKSMQDMEAQATAAAPVGKVNGGRLKNSINYKEIGKLSYELRADAPYAAYVEFGTGQYFANYPGKDAYWQEIASKFKKNGQGRTDAQPFFYPTVNKNIAKLKTRIKTILSKNA